MSPAFSVSACLATRPAPENTESTRQIEQDLSAFLGFADDSGQVRAVLVYHAGELVFERYTGTGSRDYWNTHSVTMSVLSALVGIAIERGEISSVDATLGDLLPSYAAEMGPDVAAVTLQQLLTQTGNFTPSLSLAETFWHSSDWVRAILTERAAAGQALMRSSTRTRGRT